MKHDLSRRGFLGVCGAGAAGLTLLISGCRKGGGGGSLTCTDVSGLSAAEKQARTSLKYVDKSPQAGKNCANCQLYKAPAKAGTCGTCTVIKGSINPAGYCNSWAKKAAAK
jgi:ABC-type transport system involved in cytochrome bd biosynthesis fused ATPase/permease subunit